jgi:hypothetical protein
VCVCVRARAYPEMEAQRIQLDGATVRSDRIDLLIFRIEKFLSSVASISDRCSACRLTVAKDKRAACVLIDQADYKLLQSFACSDMIESITAFVSCLLLRRISTIITNGVFSNVVSLRIVCITASHLQSRRSAD